MNSILLIIFGWLLGLLSPIIIDNIKTKRQNLKTLNTIISEITEIRLVLTSTICTIERDFGTYDRKLFEWAMPILESYRGPNPGLEISTTMKKLLELNDGQLLALAQELKAGPRGGLSVKKFRLPYLELHLADIGSFDEASQRLILDIRNKIDQFNEEIEEARFYFRLTYQSDISDENHNLASKSTLKTYLNLARMGRLIIDRINELAPLT